MNQDFPELLSADQLCARQLERLQQLFGEIHERNSFWKGRFEAWAIDVSTISSLDAFRELPFLTKDELVADQNHHPPFGANLTYPLARYSRLHQTSGTTGKPMRWLDTPDSWNWFLDCWEQIYRIVGVRPDDVFAFPFSFGPFIGFWAAFEGAQRLGNLSLTMGGMSSQARLQMIIDLNATIICCTPTYALRLAEEAEKKGFDLPGCAVRMLILAGEPGAAVPAIRQRIESAWGARVIDHWGMTDVGSLGIEPAAAPGGMVILETECLAEIIQSDGKEPVEAGEVGELVITNLGRWGQPVFRYRTGDLVQAATRPCASGLSLLRLEGGVLGRTDDMVTIRGNNVFPSSLDAILREFDDVAEYRTTVVTRRSMPHLKIEIEPAFPLEFSEEHAERCDQLMARVGQAIKDRLNFQAEVIVVETLPRYDLKGKRFFREDR